MIAQVLMLWGLAQTVLGTIAMVAAATSKDQIVIEKVRVCWQVALVLFVGAYVCRQFGL